MFAQELFKKYITSPPLKNKNNLKLWQKILTLTKNNVFIYKDSDYQKLKLFSLTTKSIKSKLLNIEEFKDNARKFFASTTIHKKFISSGTTSENKSQSYFSEDGLELYKLSSLYTFYYVLKLSAKENFLTYQPISLIPPDSTHNSLAQMLKWFAEFWKIDFIQEKDLPDYIKAINNKPCWIFATALQYWNIVNNYEKLKIHPLSLIFETGGTKGQNIHITKEDLYWKMSLCFGVCTNHIISEYSMCELSSQAYDFMPAKANIIPINKRTFKFPWWVTLFVDQGLHQIKPYGQGALIIYDPLRVDYPYSILTQDICYLYKNKKFKLIQRVPYSVLKGCSITFEPLHPSKTFIQTSCAKSNLQKWQLNKDTIYKRYLFIKDLLPKYIADKNNLKSLAQIIGSYHVAKHDLTNIKKSFYFKNFSELLSALVAATNSDNNLCTSVPTQWLFILPSSHPIAGLYPIIFSYLLDFNVKIRIPYENTHTNIITNLIQAFEDAKFTILDSSFKIGHSTIPQDVQAILIFGSNDTIKQIKSTTNLPVQGFGTYIAGSFITEDEINENLDKIIQDAFSLKQLGCMSSRFLFVFCHTSNINLRVLINKLNKSARQFWKSHLSVADILALDSEEYNLIKNKAILYSRKSRDDFLFPIYNYSNTNIHNVLSKRPLVLPIVIYKNINNHINYVSIFSGIIKKISDLKLILLSETLLQNFKLTSFLEQHHIEFKKHGQAQAPLWNGFHNNKPLFVCD